MYKCNGGFQVTSYPTPAMMSGWVTPAVTSTLATTDVTIRTASSLRDFGSSAGTK